MTTAVDCLNCVDSGGEQFKSGSCLKPFIDKGSRVS